MQMVKSLDQHIEAVDNKEETLPNECQVLDKVLTISSKRK